MTENMPPKSDGEGQARKRVGAYAKLLANYASDDAIIEAGEAAELLFVRGLAFCATSDADGFITDAQVVRYVGAGMRDAEKRARKLAQVGVWERLDGGYLVRSWTKIHETAASKGRRRKADRERKRKPEDSAESETPSERIPDGIPDEVRAESLSMTEQCSDTTAHSTTGQVDGSEGGQRSEPLRVVPASEPSCQKHPLADSPTPCQGCAAVRKWRDRNETESKRDAERALAECQTCEGMGFILDADKRPTGRRCTDHRRTA